MSTVGTSSTAERAHEAAGGEHRAASRRRPPTAAGRDPRPAPSSAGVARADDGDAGFERGEDPQRMAAAGQPLGQQAAQREAGHEARQHGAGGVHRHAEDERQQAQPQHLIGEAAGARARRRAGRGRRTRTRERINGGRGRALIVRYSRAVGATAATPPRLAARPRRLTRRAAPPSAAMREARSAGSSPAANATAPAARRSPTSTTGS